MKERERVYVRALARLSVRVYVWFVVRGSWFVVRGSWFVVRGSCALMARMVRVVCWDPAWAGTYHTILSNGKHSPYRVPNTALLLSTFVCLAVFNRRSVPRLHDHVRSRVNTVISLGHCKLPWLNHVNSPVSTVRSLEHCKIL